MIIKNVLHDIPAFSDVRPITPPAEERTEKDKPTKHHRTGERKINIANTDLLFKLFENVEKDVKRTPSTHMGKEHLKSRRFVIMVYCCYPFKLIMHFSFALVKCQILMCFCLI